MPRGYCKHQTGLSRKLQRGGGSSLSRRGGARATPTKPRTGATTTSRSTVRRRRQDQSTSSIWYQDDWYDYDFEDDSSYDSTDQDNDKTTYERAYISPNNKVQPLPSYCCPICCQEQTAPLIHLTQTCQTRHDPVCVDCLRHWYILEASQSVTNYPLQCFHPACRGTPIRHVHLTCVPGLIQSNQELQKYFGLMELAKGHKGGTKTKTAHCPQCQHPRTYRHHDPQLAVSVRRRPTRRAKNNSNQLVLYNLRCFVCKSCHQPFVEREFRTELHQTLQALQDLPFDRIGPNEGWAHCPKCHVLVSKGYGCNHMRCALCGHDFLWDTARATSQALYK